jgi:hypothetical protein
MLTNFPVTSLRFESTANYLLYTSSWPLRGLDALQGKLSKGSSGTIGGQPATEYVGESTVSSLYDAFFPTHHVPKAANSKYVTAVKAWTPTAAATEFGDTLVPSANDITIKLDVWVDQFGRVVQIRSTEPLFTSRCSIRSNKLCGQSEPWHVLGPQIKAGYVFAPTEYVGVGGSTPSSSRLIVQRGFTVATLTFSAFGSGRKDV